MFLLVLACSVAPEMDTEPSDRDTALPNTEDSGDTADTGDSGDTGDTGDTGEAEVPLCSVEQTYVGNLSLETDEEKAAFGAQYCCVDGVLEVYGDPRESLECLLEASLRLRDPAGEVTLPIFQRGRVHVNVVAPLHLYLPEWQEEAVLTFFGSEVIHVHAAKLQSLEALHYSGMLFPPDSQAHRVDMPQLQELDVLSVSSPMEPDDLAHLSGPVGELRFGDLGRMALELPALSLSMQDLSIDTLAPLCGGPTQELQLTNVWVNQDASCLLDLPALRTLDVADGNLPALRGDVTWPESVSVDLDMPSSTLRRVRFAGIQDMTLHVRSDPFYELELPDLVSGSIDIGGHASLVAELPSLTSVDTLKLAPGVANAPLLTAAGSLQQVGNLSSLTALQSADELIISSHEGSDLSALASLESVSGTLTLSNCHNLVDLSHLHGLKSVGTLQITRTGASEAEIQALIEAIGSENIGEIKTSNNGG